MIEGGEGKKRIEQIRFYWIIRKELKGLED